MHYCKCIGVKSPKRNNATNQTVLCNSVNAIAKYELYTKNILITVKIKRDSSMSTLILPATTLSNIKSEFLILKCLDSFSISGLQPTVNIQLGLLVVTDACMIKPQNKLSANYPVKFSVLTIQLCVRGQGQKAEIRKSGIES